MKNILSIITVGTLLFLTGGCTLLSHLHDGLPYRPLNIVNQDKREDGSIIIENDNIKKHLRLVKEHIGAVKEVDPDLEEDMLYIYIESYGKNYVLLAKELANAIKVAQKEEERFREIDK